MVQPPDNSANPWHQLLAKHPEIQEVPFIIPVNTGTSLVQEHAKLETAVSQVGETVQLYSAIFNSLGVHWPWRRLRGSDPAPAKSSCIFSCHTLVFKVKKITFFDSSP